MTSENKAPERIWADPPTTFDGMDIWREEPCDVATEYVRADRIAALESELARLTAERDAAMAGVVKVKPLVWLETQSEIPHHAWEAWTGFGRWVIFLRFQSMNAATYWIFSLGYPTLEAAKAAAQADYDARILAAIQPDPDARQEALARAFCMGRDMAADECDYHAGWIERMRRQGVYSAEGCLRTSAGNIRALTPPADLAAKIGGE